MRRFPILATQCNRGTAMLTASEIQAVPESCFLYRGILILDGDTAFARIDLKFTFHRDEDSTTLTEGGIEARNLDVEGGLVVTEVSLPIFYSKEKRYLEIGMRLEGSGSAYVPFFPRLDVAEVFSALPGDSAVRYHRRSMDAERPSLFA